MKKNNDFNSQFVDLSANFDRVAAAGLATASTMVFVANSNEIRPLKKYPDEIEAVRKMAMAGMIF